MKLPNADKAIIAQEKLCNYLLNTEHKRGASKAKMLVAMGYRAEDWQRLDADIRTEHLGAEVVGTETTDYGNRYEILANLRGPTGKSVLFRSVWQIDTGTDFPRLITMHPE